MTGVLADLQSFWNQYDWMFYRTAASLMVGTLVGLEREFRDKPAGLRTMILISVGSCLFSMVSEAMAGPRVDTTRIAAQVVTGVGFLGAGSILRSTKAVYGLTTAAGIWVVAAAGMACGFGQFGIAFVGTAAVLMVLILFQEISTRIAMARTIRKYRISTTDADVRFRDVEALFAQADLKIVKRNCYREGRDYVFTFRVLGSADRQTAFREKLLHMDNLVLRR